MQNKELENRIGYRFTDSSLLRTAMTHSSYANERGCESYERLEFLGDSVLGYITAEFLYRHELNIPEGRMTKLRAELVCEESLYAISTRLELGKWLRLGRGEEHSGGRTRKSILADIVEATIAAIYLDGGMEEAKHFVYRELLDSAEITSTHRPADYKSELQELVQQKSGSVIEYVLTGESGPDHNKEFTFSVFVNGTECGSGTGRSKKEAEQMAACRALEGMRT